MEKLKQLIYHLFVPNEGNNYRARALHHEFLTYYLLIAFFLVVFTKNFGYYFKNVLGFATDISVEKLYQLTNNERTKYNLSALSYNDKLANAGYQKAQDMFAKNYWAHYAPDGTTPWNFILAAGYRYEYAGENLAKNFLFTQGVIDAWMNSPTHRENILRKDYSEVGFAVVNGLLNGEETTLVVQMFGKPQGASIAQVQKEVAVPTIMPTVVVAAKAEEKPPPILVKSALAKQITTPEPKINVHKLSFDFTLIFIIFLLTVIITDFYVATRMNIIRITGKHLAHFIFLGFIFIALLLFFTKGTII